MLTQPTHFHLTTVIFDLTNVSYLELIKFTVSRTGYMLASLPGSDMGLPGNLAEWTTKPPT